ncbi:MAG TPA: lysophospholipid acyltransferase family protein [Pyrinomonadaceae bacterium]|jgi:KDO2-lipid IV(A) lauroyltransferase|nr:lysophospholipid acyltransferase family protein [Pyrinomonadaceae bacterium]
MARKSKFQIRVEYIAAAGLVGFLRVLPRRVSLLLGKLFANLGYHLLGNLRGVAKRNLEIAFPELGENERQRLTKGAFENLGRVLGEMSQFPKATPASLEKIIEFRFDPALYEKYKQWRAEGRGTIIVSPHLGNWELLVFAYSALREPISYLARPLDNPLIEELTVNLRTRFGNRAINKTNSVPTAIKILREGGTLGILADVNAHPKEGVFVPFFGVPACTSSGVAMLAIRTNAVIIPLAGVWDEKENKYLAIHGDAIEPKLEGDRQANIVDTTARFTTEVEKMIRAYPDQWLWIHKRWKSRPPGEPEIY